MALASETASVTAADTWTDWITPQPTTGYLNISISGTFVATVTLQRRFNEDGTAHEVDTWTAVDQNNLQDYEHGVEYRIGVAAGDYTSGTVDLRLSQ